MKLCPKCGVGIPERSIRNSFRCPHCRKYLDSNIDTAGALSGVVFFFIYLIIAGFSFDGNRLHDYPKIILAAIFVYFFVFRLILKLK